MAFPKHCDVLATSLSRTRHINPLIAPAATHGRLDKCRTDRPSIPPSAATSMPASRASRAQRNGPSAAAVGWLSVGNAGERNARAAPARRARTNSAPLCAELVTGPRRGRTTQGQRPARRCTPARRDAASLTSPATTSVRRRARHSRARSRPSATRSAAPSCRSTTPARPLGRRATAGRGSGSRSASVNSQSGGRSRRDGARRMPAPRRRAGHPMTLLRLRSGPAIMRPRLGSFPFGPSARPALAPLGSPTAAPQQNRHGMAHRASDLLTPPAAPSF